MTNDAWTPRQTQTEARRQHIHGPLQGEPLQPGGWTMAIIWTAVAFLTVGALFSA